MHLLIPAVHRMEFADDWGLDLSFTLLREYLSPLHQFAVARLLWFAVLTKTYADT